MHFFDNQTIHSQIADYIRSNIFGGRYKPNEKLPTIRDMAHHCRVNPNTVVKAYEMLEAEDLIYTESTNGKFVINDNDLIQREKFKFINSKLKSFLNTIDNCNISKEDLIGIIRGEKNES